MQKRKGFTLLELLIVVVILGVLALIAAPSLLNAADQAKDSVVKANESAAASSITSQFALNSTLAASAIATSVAGTLNGQNKNPVDATKAAFATTGTVAGSVVLTADDATDTIVVTGYGKKGDLLITKTIAAPAAN